MRTGTSGLRPLTFTSLLLLMSAAAYSDPPPASADAADLPAPTQPATTSVVADEKIDQFATAYVAVEGIQNQAAEQLNAAPDAESAKAVQANAEAEMIKAVERSGLQVEEFNQIVQAMVADNALRTKVIGKIEQRRGG